MVEVQLLHHFQMSSKSIYRTSNKKFSDLMQLSKQHHQIKICEASHFCVILELVAYKLISFLLKQTGICVTKTARNVHFGYMKFSWKNEFMLKMYFLPLSV